jgi:hypothetical protein
MLTETILDRLPVWLLYSGTVLLLLAASELGFRLGIRRRKNMSDGEKAPANAMMGSILGLLAFMLAFTFGMSSSRFDARKQLVLEDASAILRTYERVQFLPGPQRTECSRLLQEYVALRIRIPTLENLEDIQEAVMRSEAIQEALWQQAVTLADRPNAILAGLMTSLAEITDLQIKRVRAAAQNRIPSTIVFALYAIAFLGLATMGYGAGLAESRATIPAVVLILAFSAITVLIVDLERPRQQLFKITQEPMVDVARRMQTAQP